jgi:hypothetical protein
MNRAVLRLTSLLIPIAILLTVAIPNILSGNSRGRGYSDQVNYHERVIVQFGAQWPAPDLSDYPAVMTPLYHLLMSLIYEFVTDSIRILQLVGSIFGPMTLLALWWGVMSTMPRGASDSRRGLATDHATGGGSPAWLDAIVALSLMLPMACCMYVWDSTIWLLPDNMAWAMVAAVIALCFSERFTTMRLILAGVFLAVLIATRQSNIFLAACLWTAAYLRDDPDDHTLPRAVGDLGRRIPRLATGVVATLPAFGVLAWFWNHWGGRVAPPMWDVWYARKWNPAGGAFVLALCGLYSVFFAGYLLPAAWRLLRGRWWMLAAAGVGGALVALACKTDYDMSQGRYGAIWSLADKVPAPMGRSLFITALSASGGVALVCWAVAMDFRRRWVFVTAFAAFAATQFKNPWLYQRYAEPLILILFILAAASIIRRERAITASVGDAGRTGSSTAASSTADADFGTRDGRADADGVARLIGRAAPALRILGVAALAMILAAMAIATMRGASEVKILPAGDVGKPPSAKRS